MHTAVSRRKGSAECAETPSKQETIGLERRRVSNQLKLIQWMLIVLMHPSWKTLENTPNWRQINKTAWVSFIAFFFQSQKQSIQIHPSRIIHPTAILMLLGMLGRLLDALGNMGQSMPARVHGSSPSTKTPCWRTQEQKIESGRSSWTKGSCRRGFV